MSPNAGSRSCQALDLILTIEDVPATMLKANPRQARSGYEVAQPGGEL